MTYYELKDNDVFINTIEANPEYSFYIHSGTVYINNQVAISGNYSDNILGVPPGYVSLFEYNIDRDPSSVIYPFITKGGHKQSFKNVSKLEWNTQYDYSGEVITSSYNMSSSITRMLITSSAETNYRKLRALKTACNHYTFWSQKFNFETYYEDVNTNPVNLINIPSIFYGSSIKKGTLSLNYYISGTLAARATDRRRNGELVDLNDEIVGTVFYNEGLILLTSSAEIDPNLLDYETNTSSSWLRWGFGMNDATTVSTTSLSASFSMDFEGISELQNMTMLAKAPQFELNHSNNPTYLKKQGNPLAQKTTGSYQFIENHREVKNIVHSEQTDFEPPFEKETYISKICVYDKDKKLIGICKLATPIRKREINEYLFKLKLDL